MDDKDYHILRVLQENGRLSNQELSERVNLSPSPCLRRVRQLEKSGVIRGYTALVDQKAFGLPLTVFIRIEMERHAAEAVRVFEARIRDIPEIQDCYLVTGEADYLLRMVCRDLDAYERFMRETLHAIPGISSINTSFAFGRVKQSQVLPHP